MRVTNGMMINSVLRNLTLSQERFLNLQSVTSSGRRINKPSDDPIGTTKDLGYRSIIALLEQFRKNIGHANSWLTTSELSLSNINELVISAKELTVQMGNDTYDSNSRQAGAAQINEIFEQILESANATFEGNYIFGGTRTTLRPLLANAIGVVYQGDYSKISLELEQKSYLSINSFGANFLTNAVRTLGDGHDLNPGLQNNLWLTNLHGGSGVDLGAGLFRVRTMNGEYNIDVSAAENIQDVLDAINNLAIPNLSAAISNGDSNNLQLIDTSAHHMVNATPLGILNGGTGIDNSGLIRFTAGAITVDVDISAATNTGDVINAINSQLAAGGIANVTASIVIDKNSLVITDSNVIPLNIEISEGTTGGRTAGDLGLIGSVNSELIGRDLLPLHIQVIEDAPGQNTASELGLLGGTEFGVFEGKDINTEFTYYTLLSTLNSGAGYQLGKIRIVNGHDYEEIDLTPLNNDPNATVMDLIKSINSSGLHVEARVNEQHTGIEVFSTVDGRSLMITEADTGRTAKDLGIFGSPDLLGNLLVLKGALERNNTEEINLSLETFTGAQDRILIETSNIGARTNRALSAESRAMMYDVQMIRQLAEIEDADMTKVITDLTSAEFVYQSALASAAKILQPSLLQFLR